jgi:flagellar hook protein FlgE
MAFDSLYTGITGLNAYQSWIDMISNNIANTATTGFKGQRMTFADLFYQSQGFASGPTQTSGGVDPQQLGLGVKVNSVDTEFGQGGLETTGVSTDLAINGDGFFMLRNANGTNAPVYTRDGAFQLNSNGLLYDPASGMAVQGYTANSQGVVTATGSPGNITIPLGLQSQATGTGFGTKVGPSTSDQVFDMSLGGNIDQTQWATQEAFVASGAGTAGTSETISTTIYDSLGNAHAMTLVYTPDATGATAGPPAASGLPATVNDASGTAHVPATRWMVTASFADGTQVNGAAATSAAPYTVGYAYFDQNGQFINTSSSKTNAVPTAALLHSNGAAASIAAGNQLNVTQWGIGSSDNATAPTAGAPATPGPIGLGFADDTSLSGASTASVISQNGYAAGTLQNITVGQDGTIDGAFTNGQTKSLGQVALATFQNEDGLSRLGTNGFTATAASGLAQIGTASVGRFGSIQSGSLEDSNVSLADQFTKLIVAQRSFEANTRGITTADQNLQTLINLRASEN